jgi:rhamnosyltransferase
MSDTQRVLICLAAHEGQAHIKKQIESLLRLKEIDLKIVTSLDEANTKLKSETSRILDDYATKNLRLTVLPSIGRIGSAALNFFRLISDINLKECDYVALSDQDDIWEEDKLSAAIAQMKAASADGYSSNVTAFWSNGKIKLIHKAQPQVPYDFMFESAGPGCTFVLTHRLALDVQSFLIAHQVACKEVELHDWFIYAFARSHGYKWHIDPASHMQYRQHVANVFGANVGIKAALARWRKLRAGWLSQQAVLLAHVLGYSDQWPMVRMKRYRFRDRLFLIRNVHQLRRKWIDRLALAFFFLFPLKK